MAEIAELDIDAREEPMMRWRAFADGLPLALQCDNRYALMKFGQVLKSLGIDPDPLLSGHSGSCMILHDLWVARSHRSKNFGKKFPPQLCRL
jgi:hypothetical protein